MRDENRTRELHRQDEHCTVDPETDCCSVCGVLHGGPCPECGGRGFHRPSCTEYLNEMEPGDRFELQLECGCVHNAKRTRSGWRVDQIAADTVDEAKLMLACRCDDYGDN